MPQCVVTLSDERMGDVRRVEFTCSAFDNQVVPARLEVPGGVANPLVIIFLHGRAQSRAQWSRLAAAVKPRSDAGLFMALPLLSTTNGQTGSFTSPFADTQGFGDRKMGSLPDTQDPLYSHDGINALAAEMGRDTHVTWFDSGHDFPDDTAAISVAFFVTAS